MEAHPYDGPWKLISEMKTQVNDLRAALLAEQQQRATEVMELKKDMAVLKKEVPQMYGSLRENILQVHQDLEKSQRAKEKDVDDWKASFRQLITMLNARVSEEIEERQAKNHIIGASFESLTRESKQDTKNVQRSLDDLENLVRTFRADTEVRNNHFSHDIHHIGNYLAKCASTWSVFTTNNPKTNF